MENLNKENVRKIWQRVQQSNAPVSDRPDLCAIAEREMHTARMYEALARRIPGSNGKKLGQLARREKSHAASIRGICAVTYGNCPPISSMPPETAPVPVLLRRCYGQKLQAIGEYQKLSQEEHYGSIFRQLAGEEQEQMLFLLQLLGSMEHRKTKEFKL